MEIKEILEALNMTTYDIYPAMRYWMQQLSYIENLDEEKQILKKLKKAIEILELMLEKGE